MIRTVMGVVALLLVVGCAKQVDEREMNSLASALTKVSSAVDATVRYGDIPTGASSEQILAEATKHDSTMLSYFTGRDVLVKREGDDSAVLVCDTAARRALLEDAGCTAKMDSHRWSAPATAQCVFTLNLKAICSQ